MVCGDCLKGETNHAVVVRVVVGLLDDGRLHEGLISDHQLLLAHSTDLQRMGFKRVKDKFGVARIIVDDLLGKIAPTRNASTP